MPKLTINGVTVNMTVDELIEYQLKTGKKTGKKTIKPATTDSLTVVTAPVLDKKLQDLHAYGYRNATLVRATVVAAHEFDPRLGENRHKASDWLLNREEYEVELLNRLVSEARARVQYVEDRHELLPYGLSASFWYSMTEFDYNVMEEFISCSDSPLVIKKISKAHTDIAKAYCESRSGKTFKRMTLDNASRKKIVESSVNIILDNL